MPRPRIHPVGAEPTGADRSRSSRAARIAAGWRIVQIMLSPAATQDLAELRQAHATDTAAIEAALHTANQGDRG